MYAIEFLAKIKNGLIEIPTEYWEQLPPTSREEQVRVIVLTSEDKDAAAGQANGDLIEELLANPLEIPGFVPLSREAAHDRNPSS